MEEEKSIGSEFLPSDSPDSPPLGEARECVFPPKQTERYFKAQISVFLGPT